MIVRVHAFFFEGGVQVSAIELCVSDFVPLTFPLGVYLLTALWGEAAAHTDPEGELRDQPESAFYRGRKKKEEDLLIIVEVQASERILQSSECNLVRQAAM